MNTIAPAQSFNRGEHQKLRDDRLFFIGCDDRYAPDQYFGFFKMPRIHLCVIPAIDDMSHAIHVLEKLQKVDFEEDDERWMLLDTDHCTEASHFPSYEKAISQARQENINIAISRPSFESWLLLHHANVGELLKCTNADSVGDAIRNALGHYNKKNLVADDYTHDKLIMSKSRG